jgi:hypothetical protein
MKNILVVALLAALAACSGSPDNNDVSSNNSGSTGGTGSTTGSAALKVVSNRADLISGGDVLVEVVLDSAAALNDLEIRLNGVDVTTALEATAADPLRLLGNISGLRIGDNSISNNIGNDVTVTNHPNGGPVFTGPQIDPWQCNNGDAVDDQCNQPVTYSWLYKSSNPANGGLQPYDPENPAGDVADTTTENGETVPFIVRKETGFQGRDEYAFYTLFKEGEEWTPANPQSQWNGAVMVPHGGNCRGHHRTGAPRTDDYSGTIPANPATEQSYITALGLGWSVVAVSQLNLGHNCNLSYQAEALMMAKESFIEHYGELRYTVGSGCSGGAITQNMIANAYPGLYQGLLTTCTYPDVMSTATQFADYHILLKYFDASVTIPEQPNDFDSFMTQVNNLTNLVINANTARDGTVFTIPQQNAIYGHPNGIVNASLADSALFGEAVDPESNCGGVPDTVPDDTSTRFDQNTNPGGERCDVLTFMENMVGPRERFPNGGTRDHWSQLEKDLGYGFAGFPLGNEGVQYGLKQLQTGIITPAQFVALNTNIGGLDPSLNVTTERLKPDQPALRNAYRTGILNTIVNMDTVPIINMTGPDPGAAHDAVHGYWVRWRLDREFGHHSNFAHWGGSTVLIGNLNFMTESLLAMQDWLNAIEADSSDRSMAEKVVANRPASADDQCDGAPGMCPEAAMTVFGTPRTEAGADIYGDHVQCVLRPFDRNDDYGPGNALWDAEPDSASWNALEAAFTTTVDGVTGPFVCDWTERPLDWQPTITWLKYQDQAGDMIHGGEQMAPADFPSGWASPAFHNTWEPGWQP